MRLVAVGLLGLPEKNSLLGPSLWTRLQSQLDGMMRMATLCRVTSAGATCPTFRLIVIMANWSLLIVGIMHGLLASIRVDRPVLSTFGEVPIRLSTDIVLASVLLSNRFICTMLCLCRRSASVCALILWMLIIFVLVRVRFKELAVC